MHPIPVNIATEDSLSEAVIIALTRISTKNYVVGNSYGKRGNGYLKSNIEGFNLASRGTPFIVLTDLDDYTCAPELISDWLKVPKHNNMIFRVANREVESWILADKNSLSKYLGIKSVLIPQNVDSVKDPKAFLISLANKSRYAVIKRDIVPPKHSSRKVGPGYNSRIIEFVLTLWNPLNAKNHSDSLNRAINSLNSFQIKYEIK